MSVLLGMGKTFCCTLCELQKLSGTTPYQEKRKKKTERWKPLSPFSGTQPPVFYMMLHGHSPRARPGRLRLVLSFCIISETLIVNQTFINYPITKNNASNFLNLFHFQPVHKFFHLPYFYSYIIDLNSFDNNNVGGEVAFPAKPVFASPKDAAFRPKKLPLPAKVECDRRRLNKNNGLHIANPKMPATIFGEQGNRAFLQKRKAHCSNPYCDFAGSILAGGCKAVRVLCLFSVFTLVLARTSRQGAAKQPFLRYCHDTIDKTVRED